MKLDRPDDGAAFHLAEVGVPADPTAPWAPVWDGISESSLAHHLDLHGYDDMADDNTAASVLRYTQQDEQSKVWLVAVRGPRPDGTPDGSVAGVRLIASEPGPDGPSADDVLACAYASAPLLDNTHLLEVILAQVRPAHRRQGIEAAMVDLFEELARRFDRTTLLAWVSHRGALADDATPSDQSIADPTGSIRIRRDHHDVALLLSRGYGFAQAERHSLQPLPVPTEVLRAAADPTRATAAGYEVVQWTGLTPDEYLDDFAVLAGAMSTDPPLGDVDWRPESYDAERVRRMETRASIDITFATTAVRHRASGRVVGMTQVGVVQRKPEVAFQWSTIVLQDHRGHGLGMLLKAANARLLHEEFPDVRRVHTWNADENAYMLNVNIALGYRQESIDGCWQRVVA